MQGIRGSTDEQKDETQLPADHETVVDASTDDLCGLPVFSVFKPHI